MNFKYLHACVVDIFFTRATYSMWHGHVHLDQKHIMNTWFVCMRGVLIWRESNINDDLDVIKRCLADTCVLCHGGVLPLSMS